MERDKLKDDAKEVIKHYEEMLGKDDTKILPQIRLLMQSWKSFLKAKKLTKKDEKIFLEAIKNSNNYISDEACSRLSEASNYYYEIKKLFDIAFNDKKVTARFNVVAFCANFQKDYTKEILETAINDKSAKVREKVADVILWSQEKSYLDIIKNRLQIETNKSVISEINFALEKFDSVIINTDGSKTLRMTSTS